MLSVKGVAMPNIIEIFKASKHYSDFLDSFSCDSKLNFQLFNKTTVISEAIYFHICKMKYAGWRHRVKFKRYRKHAISDIFQDTIAFYLKAALPSDYTIEIEAKKGKTQIDIAVKRGDKYIFLIEVKTSIGWDRTGPDKKMSARITELSTNFDVPRKNIIYIFEVHSNVSKDFSDKFWDEKQQKAKQRPTDFPYSKIFPLFNATDPYYWKYEKGFKRKENCKKISDDEIRKRAKCNIVTPIEEILNQITSSTVSKIVDNE
jgi:hypothetical protein